MALARRRSAVLMGVIREKRGGSGKKDVDL